MPGHKSSWHSCGGYKIFIKCEIALTQEFLGESSQELQNNWNLLRRIVARPLSILCIKVQPKDIVDRVNVGSFFIGSRSKDF